MVNFGLNSASILGLFLAVGGALLYFIRTIRPELSRDYDIFFAAVGLLCGLILIFQGWRLDPILQFGQFLLTGCTVFFAVETLRLRGIATEQARRGTPIVDEDRPVSRVYRAELDQIEPYDNPYENEEPQYDNPRLRGYQEPRATRRGGYESDETRTPKNRRNSPPNTTRDNPKNRRPSSRPATDEPPDAWSEDGDRPYSRPRSEKRPQKPKNRPASPADLGRSYYDDSEVSDSDYVDYQPLDNAEDNYPQIDRPNRPKPRPNDQDDLGNFDY